MIPKGEGLAWSAAGINMAYTTHECRKEVAQFRMIGCRLRGRGKLTKGKKSLGRDARGFLNYGRVWIEEWLRDCGGLVRWRYYLANYPHPCLTFRNPFFSFPSPVSWQLAYGLLPRQTQQRPRTMWRRMGVIPTHAHLQAPVGPLIEEPVGSRLGIRLSFGPERMPRVSPTAY